MESADFGIWAMLMFWASAAGGILLAIIWAKRRNSNPVSRELLMRSLKKRLEQGEISQDEFDKRIEALSGK